MRTLCTLALCGALFAIVPLGADATFDGQNLPKELLLAAFAAVLAARALRPVDTISAFAFGLTAFTAASALLATNGWLAWRAAGLTLSGVVLFEASRRLDEAGRAWLVKAACIATLVLAAVTFVESQGLLPWLSRAGRAPGATIGQRNSVAHVLVLALPFVASRMPLGAVLVAGVIVLTRCRSAWLAAPVALLLARQWRALAFAAAGVLVAALLPSRLDWKSGAPLRDTLTRLFDSETGSGHGRLVQWQASLALVARHPLFGTGPANWMVEYPTVTPPGDPSFQSGAQLPTGRLLSGDWVALLVERGFPAAGAALGLAVVTVRKLPKEALGTFGALLVIGVFDSVLQLPATLAMSAVLLGASLPVAVTEPARPVAVWSVRAALAGVTVYVATLLAAFFVRQGRSFEHLERAARIAPGDPIVRLELAEAYVLEGRCADARPHLDALAAQLPNHPSVKSLVEGCPAAQSP